LGLGIKRRLRRGLRVCVRQTAEVEASVFLREVEKFHLGFWDHGDPCMDACVMHFVDISMQ
jgi:hypothetical protein